MAPNDTHSQSRRNDEAARQGRLEQEKSVKRNPHPDFKAVENSRPDWDDAEQWRYTKTRDPNWQWGQGGNDGGASVAKSHVEINPYADGRPSVYNYKLLISGIVPRPIGFLSTISADG